MRNEPLVSVVIPTRNRAHLLERAVQSVLGQTYRHLEVIIVDDASTDNTATIVSTLSDPRIHYLRQSTNQGGSAARNRGIDEAQGEFIAFLDDDDEWLPSKIAQQIKAMWCAVYQQPMIVYTGLRYVNTEGNLIRTISPHKEGVILRDLIFGNYVGSTSTVLAPKQALLTAGGFDTEQRSCQDWDLWIRLARHCAYVAVIEPLVNHYISAQRIDTNLAAQVQGRLRLLEKLAPDLKTMPWWRRRQVLTNHYIQLAGHYRQHRQKNIALQWSTRACCQNPLNLRAWRQWVQALAIPE